MTEKNRANETAIQCKELGCAETVNYRRRTIMAVDRKETKQPTTKVVYLTCANGHTHKYEVTI